MGHEGRKCGCTDPVRGKIIICLEGSASRERFAEFFVIVITKNFVGVTRLTFVKTIFLL